MESMTQLNVPPAVMARVRRFVARRTAYGMVAGFILAAATFGLAALAALALDQVARLPSALRLLIDGLLVLPLLWWLASVPMWVIRGRAGARDLRRLDNRDDDLRGRSTLCRA